MAQTGGLLCSELRRRTRTLFHLLYEDRRRQVPPESSAGRYFDFPCRTAGSYPPGISTMKGYVFVGEKVVCEAEFMAQIVKTSKLIMISPLAYIHPEAKIGENVEIALCFH